MNRDRRLWIGVIFSTILFLLYQWNENRLVILRIPNSYGEELLLYMPLKDKKRIDYLFKRLIYHNAVAYTFLGNKPVSIEVFAIPGDTSNLISFYQSVLPGNIKTFLAWQTWCKYQHHFTNGNFSIWAESAPRNEKISFIVCVNKKKMDPIVNLHKERFEEILLREDISAENLLSEAKARPLLRGVLRGHDELIGILFGYGQGNARLFAEKCDNRGMNYQYVWGEKILEEELAHLSLKNCLYRSFFANEEEKLESALRYPSFMGDPNSAETQQLKEDYFATRDKIIEFYKGKDFLQATLQLLR